VHSEVPVIFFGYVAVGCVAQWLERWSLTGNFPCPTLDLQLTGDCTYVGKPASTIGQPTRPTQPFILPRSINWAVSYIVCVLAASFGWCHLVNAYGVKSGWSCGWQVTLC